MSLVLTYDGVSRSPAEWGIYDLVLQEASCAANALTFKSCSTLAPFAYGGAVSLYEDGVRRFCGWFEDPDESRAGGVTTWSFRALGTWHKLERLVAQQAWTRWDRDEATEVAAACSRIYFGARYATDLTTGRPVKVACSTGFMLYAMLEWAIGAGIELQLGTILGATDADHIKLAGLYPPNWEESDISVAGAISSILRWHPSAVAWIDDATEPPTMHVQLAQSLSVQSVSMESAELVQRRCKARHDLVLPSVHVVYECVETLKTVRVKNAYGTYYYAPAEWAARYSAPTYGAGPDTNYEYTMTAHAPAGSSMTEDGALVYTVDWTSFAGEPNGALASAIYGEASTLYYAGSATMQMDRVGTTGWVSYVGTRLVFSDGVSGYVTASSHDIDRGAVTIDFGPSAHLSAGDWFSYLYRNHASNGKITTAAGGGGGFEMGSAVSDTQAHDPALSGLPEGFVEQSLIIATDFGGTVEKTFLVK